MASLAASASATTRDPGMMVVGTGGPVEAIESGIEMQRSTSELSKSSVLTEEL